MTRANLFNTRTVDYLELIGNGKYFSVPPYQRDYSWNTEEWDDLWADITEIQSTPGDRHYMGAVVVQAHTDRNFVVIDGQQRLATLTLLALAVVRRLEDLSRQDIEPAMNRERADALLGRFVQEKDVGSLLETSRLSLNETDDGFFKDYLVQRRDPHNPRGLPRSNALMWKCYRYFLDKLSDPESPYGDGKIVASLLSETVSRQLLFILISVEDDLNAYTVFETLNARGVALTPTDLIKNYLFSRIKAKSDLDALQRGWRSLVETVGPEKFPEFLRYHYLTAHRKIRKSRLFKIVRKEVTTPTEVFGLLRALESRAELFAAMSDANHEYWAESKEARGRVRELVLFKVSQMMPLVFTTRETFSPTDFDRVLKTLSVISFRYNVVTSRSRSELEPVYAEAAKAVADGVARKPRDVFRLLEALYVDDEEFEREFETLSVNTRGPRKKQVRYILARLETDASRRSVDFETDPGTIEHILPENAGEAWDDAFPFIRRESFLYRIGNLTLLEGGINRKIGNRSYPEKVGAYRDSRYVLTQNTAERAPEEWTPELLRERQQRMARRAVQIWRADFA